MNEKKKKRKKPGQRKGSANQTITGFGLPKATFVKFS
jgi:hypothetical protein